MHAKSLINLSSFKRFAFAADLQVVPALRRFPMLTQLLVQWRPVGRDFHWRTQGCTTSPTTQGLHLTPRVLSYTPGGMQLAYQLGGSQ